MKPLPAGFILGKYKLSRLLHRGSFPKLYQALSVTNDTTATVSLRQRCAVTSSYWYSPSCSAIRTAWLTADATTDL
ncbi:hypothetical protein VitviT2T_010487 [Vitis vinifera]|uniref:Uncharacterized protein n=1 Tax=Vitis vinifera TaxID=29760 RepID=A0ABY9C8L7_VITVI|nr:hypothetical protein VitviT2T_010487 [Vitis vinifera]